MMLLIVALLPGNFGKDVLHSIFFLVPGSEGSETGSDRDTVLKSPTEWLRLCTLTRIYDSNKSYNLDDIFIVNWL